MIAGLALLALVYLGGFASGRMHHALRNGRDHQPRLVRLLPEPKLTTPGYLASWPRAPRPHWPSECPNPSGACDYCSDPTNDKARRGIRRATNNES